MITLDPKIVDMNDGMFEILLVKKPRNTLELTECIRALREQDYDSAALHVFSARHAKLTTENTLDWSLDGEHAQSCGTIELESVKDAIRIMK